MTRDEARERLKRITRALFENKGYTQPLSELEINGWLEFFEALGLFKDNEA